MGVFGSFGWSGEALDLLETKLTDGGFSQAFEPIRVKFSPDAPTLKRCEETGMAWPASCSNSRSASKNALVAA